MDEKGTRDAPSPAGGSDLALRRCAARVLRVGWGLWGRFIPRLAFCARLPAYDNRLSRLPTFCNLHALAGGPDGFRDRSGPQGLPAGCLGTGLPREPGAGAPIAGFVVNM